MTRASTPIAKRSSTQIKDTLELPKSNTLRNLEVLILVSQNLRTRSRISHASFREGLIQSGLPDLIRQWFSVHSKATCKKSSFRRGRRSRTTLA